MADFYRPSLPGDADQDGQRDRAALRGVAVVERQVRWVGQAAADQQPVPRRGGADPRPGVVAVALAAAPARAGLPRRIRHHRRHRGRRRLAPGRQRDGEVHRDREHVPLPGLLACLPQLRAAAVDLVGGHPGERDPGAGRASDHLRAQRGPGDERRAVRDVRLLKPRLVTAPGLRKVEPEVQQRMRAGGDVRGEDDGLAVLYLPGDPGMLAGDAGRRGTFLQLRGLIQHEDRLIIAQVSGDEPLQRRQRLLPVPRVLRQQRLHPPRRGMPGLLRQLPARLAVTPLRQQRPDIRKRRQPRPGLREHRSQHAPQLTLKFSQPAGVLYHGPGGHPAAQSSHRARAWGGRYPYQSDTPCTPGSPGRQVTNPDCSTGRGWAPGVP